MSRLHLFPKLIQIDSYPHKLFSDVGLVIGIWIVGVHELDRVEDALGVEGVVVLVDVVLHHHVEEVPAHRVVRRYGLVPVYNFILRMNDKMTNFTP